MALKVLAEKLNVQGIDKSSFGHQLKASACLKAVEEQYIKVINIRRSGTLRSVNTLRHLRNSLFF